MCISIEWYIFTLCCQLYDADGIVTVFMLNAAVSVGLHDKISINLTRGQETVQCSSGWPDYHIFSVYGLMCM